MKWLVILFLSFFSLVPLAPLEAQAPAGPEAEAALALAFGPKTALSPCPCGLGGPCTCAPLSCTCPACQASVEALPVYTAALKRARQEKKPLLVGIRCTPAAGDWVRCQGDAQHFGDAPPGPWVVLSVPNPHLSGGMEWLHTFQGNPTAQEVNDLLGRKKATVPGTAPLRQMQPALQARGGACSG